jgi:hypothetical protein
MEHPRYKTSRPRIPGKGAFADFAAAVLSGSVVATPARARTYRAWRRRTLQAPAADKIEG